MRCHMPPGRSRISLWWSRVRMCGCEFSTNISSPASKSHKGLDVQKGNHALVDPSTLDQPRSLSRATALDSFLLSRGPKASSYVHFPRPPNEVEVGKPWLGLRKSKSGRVMRRIARGSRTPSNPPSKRSRTLNGSFLGRFPYPNEKRTVRKSTRALRSRAQP